MNNKKILLICLLLTSLLVLAASCENLFGGGGISSSGKGITIEYTSFPRTFELYENQPFRIGVVATNHNTVGDPVEGWICFSDDLTDRYHIPKPFRECQSLFLTPASVAGESSTPLPEQFWFPETASGAYINLDEKLTRTSTITTSLKFKYRTEAGQQLCVKQPFLEESQLRVSCSDFETFSRIQQIEGPLKISKIDKEVTPINEGQANVNLEITIEKSSSGELLNLDQVSPDGLISSQAVVEFEANLDGEALKCSPVQGNKILFRSNENKKVINCNIPVTISQEYIQRFLTINVDYGFQIDKPLNPIELKKRKG